MVYVPYLTGSGFDAVSVCIDPVQWQLYNFPSPDQHFENYMSFLLPVLLNYWTFSACLCLLFSSVMWHPSGDSTTFITLADSHILVCDIEPSGKTAKVCANCCCLPMYIDSCPEYMPRM